MKFVLKDGENYFAGLRQVHECEEILETDLIGEAEIFELFIVEGRCDVSPPLPEGGDWTPVAVTVTVKEV